MIAVRHFSHYTIPNPTNSNDFTTLQRISLNRPFYRIPITKDPQRQIPPRSLEPNTHHYLQRSSLLAHHDDDDDDDERYLDTLFEPSSTTQKSISPVAIMASQEISKQYVPLTCHGHSRPVTHLSFSGFVGEEEYYMISACKGVLGIQMNGGVVEY